MTGSAKAPAANRLTRRLRSLSAFALWLVGLAIFSAWNPLIAAQAGEQGGRDVSVTLFSTQALRSVTVTPLAAGAWTARCQRCAHRPLTVALQVRAPADVYAGGTLRVSDDASHEQRTATGLWHLRGTRVALDAVLTLPSERYVAAVLGAEASPGEPAESLRALAIVARTYALNGHHFSSAPGHLFSDLCDSTECQAMRLTPVTSAIEDATNATAGETLWFGSRRAGAFFHQDCGGMTEDVAAVWPALRGLPYLRSHDDPYCRRHAASAWHAEISLGELASVAAREDWHLPREIVAVRVVERSVSHRAESIDFTGRDGTVANVAAGALRFGIGRSLGWNHVRSNAYDLGLRNGVLVFDGRGYGHGVGLCQAGAAEMAREGKSAREILSFYFPGTAVRILPSDEGWQEARAGQLALYSTRTLSASRAAALEQSWKEAQMRFPPRRVASPRVVFAPTTEIFRQLTTQPGWALASTRGSTIVLQPDSVLRAHGGDTSALLLHEMLHVLVESESSERAPLWLREGLVEVLAGEKVFRETAADTRALDDALLHADSHMTSARAHALAAARVHALVLRYGSSTVRGWLSSGVPSSAM